MENNAPDNSTPALAPPRLLPSFVEGFNMAANNIHLILLPVLLDVILWFGPHLRIKAVFLPLMLEAIEAARETSKPETLEVLATMEEIWKLFLERYNLISAASAFPFGIPSLMVGQAPLLTPLGKAEIYEVPTPSLILLAWLLFSGLGFVLGGLYFNALARCFQKDQAQPASFWLDLRVLLWQIAQMIVFVIFIILALTITTLPIMMVLPLVVLISPLLAWVVLLGMSFLVIWQIVPLIFSLHGVFTLRQNILDSARASRHIVKHFLPGTSLFLLIAIVLYQGLGSLWRIPPETSWMALIGVFGHAFISTGIIASSFVYYFNCRSWVQIHTRQVTPPSF